MKRLIFIITLSIFGLTLNAQQSKVNKTTSKATNRFDLLFKEADKEFNKIYKMEKTIYDLKLHESMIVETHGEGYPYKWQVIRVASGWIYVDVSREVGGESFVPFDDNFKPAIK